MNKYRRQALRGVIRWGAIAALMRGQDIWGATEQHAKSKPDSPEAKRENVERKMRDNNDMKRAEEREAKNVELLYSTKPKHVLLGKREYRIPSNFFGPKQRDEPDTFDAQENGFGFQLFLPDYGGYTKENWRDRFDRRQIHVLWVKTVDKKAIVTLTDGTRRQVSPSSYGDSKARFDSGRSALDERPSFKMYDLEGYRYKGGGATPGAEWTGRRSNGEFFLLKCSLAPDKPVQPGTYPSNPSCRTQYYSEEEDLSIAYVYSQDHMAKWREIDDAIWTKLRSWRTK